MTAELARRKYRGPLDSGGICWSSSALIAIRLLNLNEPRATLAALHLTLDRDRRSCRSCSRGRPMEPALEVTSSAIVARDARRVHRWRRPQEWYRSRRHGSIHRSRSWRSSWPAWACDCCGSVYGIIRLSRFSASDAGGRCRRRSQEISRRRSGCRRATSSRQAAAVHGPLDFFGRPIALPAGFDALVPAFQRAVICHELRAHQAPRHRRGVLSRSSRSQRCGFIRGCGCFARASAWRASRSSTAGSSRCSAIVTITCVVSSICPATISRRTFRRRAQACCARASCARGSTPSFRRYTCRACVSPSPRLSFVAVTVATRTDCHCGDAAAVAGAIADVARRPAPANQQGVSGISARRARARNQRGRHRRYHRECGW